MTKITTTLLSIFAAAMVLTASSISQAVVWGNAGCGLGNIVMGKDNQILASTTNGTSGSQTFGITSGTSNCIDAGTVRRGKAARAFIESNQHQLANDISKGGGEAVAGLAQILECKDANAFGADLQRDYQVIFPSEAVSSDHVEATIKTVASKSAGHCRS